MLNNHSIILAIDTSCDDTSASIVKDGKEILSNIVSNQNEIHEKYGGIVPELASRKHIELIWYVVDEAIESAGITLNDLSAIAVCYGPGLIGSLIVGCSFAKSIAYAKGIPLIGVNHLEGHIFTAFIMKHKPEFPFLSLVISGGHTALYRVDGFNKYKELGRTRDDAAGEAYDKVAKMLNIGYPGGPIIDKLAKKGNPETIVFPRAYIPNTLDFSFSGLKTAVRNFIKQSEVRSQKLGQGEVENICASFQASVIDVLLKKIGWALQNERLNTLTIAGGVAANMELRKRINSLGEEKVLQIFIPTPDLCTDNAAMIAAAGHFYFINNKFSNLSLNPKAYLPL